MKKYYVFIISLIVLYSCDVRRKDKIGDDGAKLTELALKDSTEVQLIDSVFNFGTINEGDKVERSFKFKNTGKKALVISNATASCGCTVPEKPEQPIKPGQTGIIKVVFNSQGKEGHQEKTITVTANTFTSFPYLKLVGDVTPVKK